MPSFSDLPLIVRHYLFGFWRRRWLILAIAWGCALVGWFYVAMLPNQYQAFARISVETETILDDVLGGMVARQDMAQRIERMRRTILNRDNVEQIIVGTNLDYETASLEEKQRMVTQLQGDIAIRNQGQGLFDISYTHEDARRAQRVVDAVMKLFVEQNLGDTQRDLEGTIAFMNDQIDNYSVQIEEKKRQIAEYRRLYGDELDGYDSTQSLIVKYRNDIDRLASERDSMVWSRNELRRQLAETPATVRSSATENTLDQLERDLYQLRSLYTDEHPDVKELQRRISFWRARGQNDSADGETNPLYTQISRALSQAESKLNELDYREESMRKEIERLENVLKEAPEAQARMGALVNDLNVLEQLHAELISRRSKAVLTERVDEESNTIEYRIIERPFVPTEPVGPQRGLFSLAVLLGALGVGGAVAFLLIQLDRTYTSVEQLADSFGLPVLGSVSVVKSRAGKRVALVETSVLGASFVALFLAWSLIFFVFEIDTSILGWRNLPLDLG